MDTAKKDCSMSMAKANVILIPFMAAVYGVMVGLQYLIWGTVDGEGLFGNHNLLPLFIGGILAHEAIHGITWMIVGNIPKEQIKYGFQWKTLTPFAHSKVPMTKSAYKIGAVMPGILLGILPYLIGLATGSIWVMYFGALFTIMASGDALILWMIKDVEEDELIEDHPSRAGCYILPAVSLS